MSQNNIEDAINELDKLGEELKQGKTPFDNEDRSVEPFNAIKVTLPVEGFHRWLDAPDEVAFLRNYHRHLFKIEAVITVMEDDRELEFFLVQKKIREFIQDHIVMQDMMLQLNFDWEDFYEETGYGDNEDVLVINSCESFASYLIKRLANTYGLNRYIRVEVWEDGENSGMAEI